VTEVVAAIDCGTNTIKLLVGALPQVSVREMRMVRLGEGVDRTGELSPAALERTFAALDEYAVLIREHGATRVRFCATSATRDARNADVFVAGVRARLGIEPEVVSGEEEAALAFDGAVRSLATSPAPPALVIDIGGGSTELILGDEVPISVLSLDLGSVRLTERHLHGVVAGDPPTADEVAACVGDIERHLDSSSVDIASAATVVGVAGTITTIAGGVLGLTTDRGPVEPVVVPVADVHALVERLLAMTVAERRALPWMHPGRADVIAGGALMLDRVLARARVADLVVSPTDILDGIAWSLVGRA
jgi:exopolyphosphatase / guanosine-5'-triphosphate,3'-diphosphate pyrophosphatase